MSRGEDDKLADALEAELDSLLARTPMEADKPTPDKAIVESSTCLGDVARALGVISDNVLLSMTKRLHIAAVVPDGGCLPKGKLFFKLFDAGKFIQKNLHHPLIRRMATLPPKMTQAEEAQLFKELRTEFPHYDLPKRHEESEIS